MREDLNLDSLEFVELIMELEEHWGFRIPDRDYERLKTVGDLLRYARERGLTIDPAR